MAQKVWAGVDAGKSAHHCVVIDASGKRLLSRRVKNVEQELTTLIDDVLGLTESTVDWATDLNRGPVSLLLALLYQRQQHVIYLPGRKFAHAAALYGGEAKSDAKDAAVLADHARSRINPHYLQPATTAGRHLSLLTRRRIALMHDRTRSVNRLRGILTESFPALDASFRFATSTAALTLVTKYQTPIAIRKAGAVEIETWLRDKGCICVGKVAAAALEAAKKQSVAVPGEQLAGVIVGQIAEDILRIDAAIAQLRYSIEAVLRKHQYTPIILSMPGFGTVLTAEFIALTGGTMQNFPSSDKLAAFSGVAPVSKDSGNTSGNNRLPQAYDRRLRRVWYLSSSIAANVDEPSRRYYDRKRSEGKKHPQAVLSLSRRRVNVLWAMLRDNKQYEPRPSPQAPEAE
ncbi:IS110 family transposase [Nocardia fluminea]|uniref:IS110 family transposase n=1 Tax=Nocardia fluminea TaxID=134984 RepID=UPI00340BE597